MSSLLIDIIEPFLAKPFISLFIYILLFSFIVIYNKNRKEGYNSHKILKFMSYFSATIILITCTLFLLSSLFHINGIGIGLEKIKIYKIHKPIEKNPKYVDVFIDDELKTYPLNINTNKIIDDEYLNKLKYVSCELSLNGYGRVCYLPEQIKRDIYIKDKLNLNNKYEHVDYKNRVSEPILKYINENYNNDTISGFVWYENKNTSKINNQYDKNDTLVPKVDVMLYDKNHVLIKQTVTNKYGIYKFDNIKEGNYYISFSYHNDLDGIPVISNYSKFKETEVDSKGPVDIVINKGKSPIKYINQGYF